MGWIDYNVLIAIWRTGTLSSDWKGWDYFEEKETAIDFFLYHNLKDLPEGQVLAG